MMAITHIETIQILPFGMLNAFLLIGEGNAILVDSGLPNSEQTIAKALQKNELTWSDISLIVLTHAHVDHAGCAAKLRTLTSAPILAHKNEVPFLRGKPPILHATGLFGSLFRMTGAIERPFDYLTPDICLSKQTCDLQEFGFPARIISTPGHTSGSISVQIDSERVIVGDLAASGILLGGIAFRGRPKSPPFEENSRMVSSSLKHLLALGLTEFYLGHGGPLNAIQISKHIEYLDTRASV